MAPKKHGRRAGVVIVLLGLLILATPARAEATVDGSPFGSLDRVTVAGAAVHVAGWAKDPTRAGPIEVHVYVDGVGTLILRADEERKDLRALFEPWHGFTADFTVGTGSHTLCAYAINADGTPGGNVLLGCHAIHTDSRLVGVFDGVDGAWRVPLTPAVGYSRVRGWAVDPDRPVPGVKIDVYVDGKWNSWNWTREDRWDVADAFAPFPLSAGFDFEIFTEPGEHEVCVYALNILGTPGDNALLGCKMVYDGRNDPYGHIDHAKATATGVDIAGWVVDPQSALWVQFPQPGKQGYGAIERIKIAVDGAVVLQKPVNVDRPDVVAAAWYGEPFRLAPTPRYGFQYDVPLPSGKHRVCVIGEHHPYDASPYRAGRDAEIGCANVTRA